MSNQGTNDPRFARLPKWAQIEITRLESNVGYWRGKATAGPDNSDTFADRYHDDNGKPLGTGTRVTFVLGDGIEFKAHINRRDFKRPTLEVMSTGMMGRGLLVRPSVSNVVHIQHSED